MSYSLSNLRYRAVSKEYLTYKKGWDDAFGIIADYVEAEICLVTAEMIRRIKTEKWRKGQKNDPFSNCVNTVNNSSSGGDV